MRCHTESSHTAHRREPARRQQLARVRQDVASGAPRLILGCGSRPPRRCSDLRRSRDPIAEAVLRACAIGSARGPGEMASVLADVVQEVFVKAFAPDAPNSARAAYCVGGH